MAQRAVEEIISKDQKQMKEILNGSRNIRQQLERYYNRTQSIDTLVTESRAPDLIHDNLIEASIGGGGAGGSQCYSFTQRGSDISTRLN